MKNLKIFMQVSISECDDDGKSDSHSLVYAACNRIIDKDLRQKLDGDSIKSIAEKEIEMGSQYLSKKILESVKLPLNIDTKEQEVIINRDLKEMFPKIDVWGFFTDGVYHIPTVFAVPRITTNTDICHPNYPEQYLTTVYGGMMKKLSNGRWALCCQSGCYYEGYVQYVDPPFDESVVSEYFRSKGIEFDIYAYEEVKKELPPKESNDEDRE